MEPLEPPHMLDAGGVLASREREKRGGRETKVVAAVAAGSSGMLEAAAGGLAPSVVSHSFTVVESVTRKPQERERVKEIKWRR